MQYKSNDLVISLLAPLLMAILSGRVRAPLNPYPVEVVGGEDTIVESVC